MRIQAALHRFSISLFASLFILIAALASSACAASEESSDSSSALTALLPSDTSKLEVMAVGEILGGAAPPAFTEQFEAAWENYTLGDDLLTIYDVDQLVQVLTKDGEFSMISGSQLDFTGISEWLADEETNVEKTPYRGEEIWGNNVLAIVILERDGYIAIGETEAIKELLKVKARGTGSLAQDSDSALKKAYDDAASGWYVRASESCAEFSETLRACEAYSVTAGPGEEDFLVEIDYRFLFRSEQRAESQALDVEDLFDDMDWDADLEEVKADDTAVEAKVTGDEEDFDFKWLIYVQRRVPDVLPTAVLEPTSAPSSRNATRRAAATSAPAPTLEPTPRVATRSPAATSAPAPTLEPTPRVATRSPAATAAQKATTEELGSCHSKIISQGVVEGVWFFGCNSTERPGSFANFYTFSLSKTSTVVIELTSGWDDYMFYLYEGEGDRGRLILNSNRSPEIQLSAGDYTIEVTNPITGPYTLSLTLPYE